MRSHRLNISRVHNTELLKLFLFTSHLLTMMNWDLHFVNKYCCRINANWYGDILVKLQLNNNIIMSLTLEYIRDHLLAISLHGLLMTTCFLMCLQVQANVSKGCSEMQLLGSSVCEFK